MQKLRPLPTPARWGVTTARGPQVGWNQKVMIRIPETSPCHHQPVRSPSADHTPAALTPNVAFENPFLKITPVQVF